MPGHIQITFTDLQPEQQEQIIAHLAEAGYDGFQQEDISGGENENQLKAFIRAGNFDKSLLQELAYKYQLKFSEEMIPEQNWNASWESDFQPVVIEDLVRKAPWLAIRAAFHEPVPGAEHEIVITPKMSFGTGHHATTHMMAQQMKEISFAGKTVFDFGTGTGILSILAEKLGAKRITAIDNDDWSITNAAENFEMNNSQKVMLSKADTAPEGEQYDIILANINKNVILENFASLKAHLGHNGILLVSGILTEDEHDMVKEAGRHGLNPDGKAGRDNWICLRFNC